MQRTSLSCLTGCLKGYQAFDRRLSHQPDSRSHLSARGKSWQYRQFSVVVFPKTLTTSPRRTRMLPHPAVNPTVRRGAPPLPPGHTHLRVWATTPVSNGTTHTAVPMAHITAPTARITASAAHITALTIRITVSAARITVSTANTTGLATCTTKLNTAPPEPKRPVPAQVALLATPSLAQALLATPSLAQALAAPALALAQAAPAETRPALAQVAPAETRPALAQAAPAETRLALAQAAPAETRPALAQVAPAETRPALAQASSLAVAALALVQPALARARPALAHNGTSVADLSTALNARIRQQRLAYASLCFWYVSNRCLALHGHGLPHKTYHKSNTDNVHNSLSPALRSIHTRWGAMTLAVNDTCILTALDVQRIFRRPTARSASTPATRCGTCGRYVPHHEPSVWYSEPARTLTNTTQPI